MTIAGPRSGRNGKVEPVPPWIGYDPHLDAYSSWLLAMEWMHERAIDELVVDHDPRMPEETGNHEVL